MTDDELRELVASLAIGQKEFREGQKELQEAQKETDRQLKELGKQIGGLGNKFGSFTEGMAFPSMEKVLRQRFGMEFIALRVGDTRNGEWFEVDVMAYSNTSTNAVYLVEVKSHLKEEGLQQILRALKRFPSFFPEHADKDLYGILAVVDVQEELKARVLNAGVYLATIYDDLFKITIPEGFVPHSFHSPSN